MGGLMSRTNKMRCQLLGGVVLAMTVAAEADAQTTASPEPSVQPGAQVAALQQDEEESATGLKEIVVTAQKRGERLIDVPVSVTAVEPKALAQQNLVRLIDYATRVPGLVVPSNNVLAISIRGINTGTGTNPTVSVTIDDVPVNASTRIPSNFPDLDPSDLNRIEVLRGPQGTLYGAASLGGLIKLVTSEPDTTRFSGRVEAGFNYAEKGGEGYVVRGAVNIPILADRLAVRASAFRRDDPPFIDNVNPLVRLNDSNTRRTEGTRIALLFRPVEELTINLSRLDQTVRGQNGSAVQLTSFPTDYRPVRGYYVTNVGPQTNSDDTRLYSAKVDLDLGPVTLTSVSGWSRISTFTDSDLTTTFPYVFGRVPSIPFSPLFPTAPAGSSVRLKDGNSVDKYSQEVRLSSTGAGPFQWLIGGFYTNERVDVRQVLQGFDPSGALLADIGDFPVPSRYREKAAFADLTYRFTDKFDVQIGGRYSHNDQTVRQDQTVASVAVPLFGASRTGIVTTSSDDAFTFLVTPRYKFNPDIMVYGRVASGYRPGGPNLQATGSPAYGSDRVINYEIGAKGYLFGRALTVDAAVFDIEWRDIQLQNTSPSNLAFLTNGGRARSRGIEGALQWSPGAGFVVNGNATYTDAILTETLPTPAAGAAIIGTNGTRLPFSPRFTSNLGVTKKFELQGDLTLTLGANWSHIGDRSALLRSTTAPAARRGTLLIPAYDLVDLRATVAYRGFDFSIYARNVGNEYGLLNIDDRQGAVPTTNGSFVAPRVVGLIGSFSF